MLLLEHPDVFTLGVHADPDHVLVDPSSVGATTVRTDRGGDVTYHGPGQVVGYPIVTVPMGPGAIPGHVHAVEQLVIDALAELGLASGRCQGYPGVWVDADGPEPRKICAIGVRVSRGRSMHGLALNVDPDMSWFDRIIPCGIRDRAVTSLAVEGINASVIDVVELLAQGAARRWAPDGVVDRQDVITTAPRSASLSGSSEATAPGAGGRLRIRLRQAGVDPDGGLGLAERKPAWLRVPARMGDDFLSLRRTMRDLDLVTVCEEAGCPEHLRMLGRRDRHLHDQRLPLHPGLRVLPSGHPPPAPARRR